MFPIPWNFPYRKKNGDVTTIGEVIGGGGGSDIPPHTIADAGKVLTVGNDNSLEWVEVSSGVNQFDFANSPKSVSTVQSKATKGGN